jgi:hypothetical protein
MSDVVKGTAKPLTRETKPPAAQSPQKDTTIAPSSSTAATTAPTSPPLSPKKLVMLSAVEKFCFSTWEIDFSDNTAQFSSSEMQ